MIFEGGLAKVFRFGASKFHAFLGSLAEKFRFQFQNFIFEGSLGQKHRF